jgi:hypothetical protein
MLMEAKANYELYYFVEREMMNRQLPEGFWTQRLVPEAKAALKNKDVETLIHLATTPEGRAALKAAPHHKAKRGRKPKPKRAILKDASRVIDQVHQIGRGRMCVENGSVTEKSAASPLWRSLCGAIGASALISQLPS